MAFTIRIENAVPRFHEFQMQEAVSWEIKEGENWAVVGPNGAGKTLLTDILQGRIVLKEGKVQVQAKEKGVTYHWIKSIAFRDIYSLTDCRNMYYQQRWNSWDAEEAPLAVDLFRDFLPEQIVRYAELFRIEDLLGKRIIALSSGELRKALITRTLISEPKLLILDNPFIGLDAESRQILDRMLAQMSGMNGLQIILVLSDSRDIPEWIHRIQPVLEKRCLPCRDRSDFLKDTVLLNRLFPEMNTSFVRLPFISGKEEDYQETIRMEAVTVRYGERIILKDIDWCVKKGEKWALLGKNGSGKSTLLSLVCGDNPQAYANRLFLFGRRRGTGESIWDIKGRIGYLSPDMHTYYLQDIPCIHVVASGFFDSVGLYRKCNEEQLEKAKIWLEVFHAAHLAERSFVRISYGEQRLVLLARAFVKNPELMILDEPMHGLDAGKRQLAKKIIESFCNRKGKTLVYVTHYREEIPDGVEYYKILGE